MRSSKTIRRALIIAIPVLIVAQAIVFIMLRESNGSEPDGADVRPTLAHADPPSELSGEPPGKLAVTPEDTIETTPVAEPAQPDEGEPGEVESAGDDGDDPEIETVAAITDDDDKKSDSTPRRVTRRKDRRRPSRRKRARVSSEPQLPKSEPEKPEPAVALANFRSTPSGAAMALDGMFIGTTPMSDVKVAPGRHRLAFSHPGYESKVKEFVAETNKLTTIKVTLSKSPAPEKVAKKDDPPKTDHTATARKEKPARPRTPRVSSGREGRASVGKSLVGSKCNSCHRKKGASSVSAGRYTRSQWTRFFAGGVHDRYDRLGGLVSSGDLAHIKAYLKSRAADVARDQGAGVQ